MKTSFSPMKHGFHFGNHFVNKIVHIGFSKIESYGRCGGMAFASLDYYFANIPIPTHEPKDFPDKKVPPDGSILADYIYGRQINSFLTPSAFKFIYWSLSGNNKDLIGKNILYKSKNEEFLKLKKSIDSGKPVVLGLIGASKVKDITKNHQVVAYGYEFDSTEERILINIYDNNAHDREITLEFDKYSSVFKESNGQEWRGFFVQDYHFKHPRYKDLIIKESMTASTIKIYTVKNVGQFTANTKYIELPNDNNSSNIEILPGEEKVIAP